MLLKSFLNYLQYEKRYSKHTIISYKTDLEQFKTFLSQQYELVNIELANHMQVRSWIVHMMQNQLTAKSVNRKISSLKSFYKFHKKKGNVTSNPMQKIVSPKQSKRLPSYVREDKLAGLLKSDNFTADFYGIRDLLILEILYQTGIRRSELISIENQSININSKTLKVLGKGNKERLIPIKDDLVLLIKSYNEYKFAEFPHTEHDYVLVTDKGQKMYPKFVYNKVKAYLDIITTSEKKSPHILRHSFATHLANRGAELNAIKSLLGHSSLAATQIYTHNTIEKLKTAYNAAHPKA